MLEAGEPHKVHEWGEHTYLPRRHGEEKTTLRFRIASLWIHHPKRLRIAREIPSGPLSQDGYISMNLLNDSFHIVGPLRYSVLQIRPAIIHDSFISSLKRSPGFLASSLDKLGRSVLTNLRDLYTESGQTLQGSFSAVSNLNFANIYT